MPKNTKKKAPNERFFPEYLTPTRPKNQEVMMAVCHAIATRGSSGRLVVRSAGAWPVGSLRYACMTRLLEFAFCQSRGTASRGAQKDGARTSFSRKKHARTVRGGRGVDILRPALGVYGPCPGRGALTRGAVDTGRIVVARHKRPARDNAGLGQRPEGAHGNQRASRRLGNPAQAWNATCRAERGGHTRRAERSGVHDTHASPCAEWRET